MAECPSCQEPLPDEWQVTAHLALRHGLLPTGEAVPLTACPVCGDEYPTGLVESLHQRTAHPRRVSVEPLPSEVPDRDALVDVLPGTACRVRVTVTDPRRGETRTFTVRGGERCCHLAPALTGDWARDARSLDFHRRADLITLRRGILAAATGESVTTAAGEASARRALLDAAEAGDETASATLRTLAELPRRWGERHPRPLVQNHRPPSPPEAASGLPVPVWVETPDLPGLSSEAGTRPRDGLSLPWLPPLP